MRQCPAAIPRTFQELSNDLLFDALKDVDYLDAVGDTFKKILADAGIATDDVRGKVRSVTYRAVRPA